MDAYITAKEVTVAEDEIQEPIDIANLQAALVEDAEEVAPDTTRFEQTFTITYENTEAFICSLKRQLRASELNQRRLQQRLAKKLARAEGRPARPRKPAPNGRSALVAAQKKARP